jgi:parallel beta helix pectate lyase-like protein/pectate lyase-like protein
LLRERLGPGVAARFLQRRSSPGVRATGSALAFAALLLGLHGGPVSLVRADDQHRYGRMCAPPDTRSVGESARFVIGDAAGVLARHHIAPPKETAPRVNVDDFGAKGDGVTDDSEAIARALRALPGGGTLVFTPEKTYVKTGLLELTRPGVKLWGYGAVLYSVVTDPELDVLGQAKVAIHLVAPHTAVYGLTLVSNMRGRAVGHPNLTGIWLAGEDQEAIDNRLEYSNIFVREAQRFVVARNVVYRSTADGIHVTTGSGHGQVIGNVVRETGDDMIAVVSYGLGESHVGPVLIEDNDVSAQYWGRGISVVGGHDVEIRHNRISRTPFGAAILVHSETSYKTSNAINVVIDSNQIRDVQTRKPAYNPADKWKKTGHGAIDVYGQGDQLVSHVSISNNTIEDTDRDAIFVRGNSCDVDILGNHAEGVGRDAVRIEINPRPDCRIACSGNVVVGAAKLDARCLSREEAKR